MSGRTLKPSSLSIRPRRPSYTRSSSQNSIRSQTSVGYSSGAEASDATPVTDLSKTSTTHSQPPRKGSRPIAIELPARRKGSIQPGTPTPPAALTGRGEKLGGFFPFHDDKPSPSASSSYKPHPFFHDSKVDSPSAVSPKTSSGSSRASPRHSSNTPVMDHISIMSSTISLGKYHPSNYKSKPSSAASSKPNSTASIPKISQTPPSSTTSQSFHLRQTSLDMRKKIQAYQRDIMEQAARAAGIKVPGQEESLTGPRLNPLASPGPVTPFELGESDGYLVAGLRSNAGLEGASTDEIVGAMIERERSRESTIQTPSS